MGEERRGKDSLAPPVAARGEETTRRRQGHPWRRKKTGKQREKRKKEGRDKLVAASQRQRGQETGDDNQTVVIRLLYVKDYIYGLVIAADVAAEVSTRAECRMDALTASTCMKDCRM